MDFLCFSGYKQLMLDHRIIAGDNNKKRRQAQAWRFRVCFLSLLQEGQRAGAWPGCKGDCKSMSGFSRKCFLVTVPSAGQQKPTHSLEVSRGRGSWNQPRKATEPTLEPRQGQGRPGLPDPPTKCPHVALGVAPLSPMSQNAGHSCCNTAPFAVRSI